MKKAEVGDARKVSFRNYLMVIQEILENPEITMDWTWAQIICPHCRKKIDRTKTHKFLVIEILLKMGVDPEDAKIDDIVIAGFTEDKKNMVLVQEKFNEVFLKSEKFKHLAEV